MLLSLKQIISGCCVWFVFHTAAMDFVVYRLTSSDALLCLVVDTLEKWVCFNNSASFTLSDHHHHNVNWVRCSLQGLGGTIQTRQLNTLARVHNMP